MSMFPAEDVARLLQSGMLSISEEGKGEGAQFFKPGERRAVPFPKVDYPHKGDLLQNERLKSARSKDVLPRLEEALGGLFSGIQENVPYPLGPRGSQVSQFITVKLDPDMPYELSRLVPLIPQSRAETEEIYNHARKVLSSTKYPAAQAEVRAAMADIFPYLPRMQQVVNLGLARGPMINAVNVNQAIRSGLLLFSAATIPESAAMSTYGHKWMRRGNLSGELARGAEVERRMVEDVVSAAKGAKGQFMGLGGPRLAEAMRMFTQMVGPMAGLRKSRDPQKGQPLAAGLPPELLGFGPGSPVFQPVDKNMRAIQAFEMIEGVNPEVVALSEAEKAKRIEATIQQAMGPEDFNTLLKAAGKLPKKGSFERARALLANVNDPDFAKATQNRYRNLALHVVEQVADAPNRRPTAPSLQRQTAAMIEAGALGGMVPQREAENIASKMASKMRIKLNRNSLGMVVLLASILSTGFLAAGPEGEAEA